MKSFYCCRHEKSGNEQFVTEISKWVFHERGHLKVRGYNVIQYGTLVSFSFYSFGFELTFSEKLNMLGQWYNRWDSMIFLIDFLKFQRVIIYF